MNLNLDAIDPDAQRTGADERALAALTGKERLTVAAESIRPATFVRQKYDLDPSSYDAVQALADDLHAAAQSGDVTRLNADSASQKRFRSGDGDSGNKATSTAEAALTGQERFEASKRDIDASTYIRVEYDLNPRKFSDPGELRAAIDERGGA